MSAFPRARIPSITGQQWELARELFRRVGATIEPAQLRSELGLKREAACTLILGIAEAGQADLNLVVFHHRDCVDYPVAIRPYSDGYLSLPWRCHECGRLVTDPDELRYEFQAVLRVPIEFVDARDT